MLVMRILFSTYAIVRYPRKVLFTMRLAAPVYNIDRQGCFSVQDTRYDLQLIPKLLRHDCELAMMVVLFKIPPGVSFGVEMSSGVDGDSKLERDDDGALFSLCALCAFFLVGA